MWGETFDAPTAGPLSNSDPHVAGPTMPSTSSPARAWYWRTAVSVWGPKMPSDGICSAVWTCATNSPWLPYTSGRPPSRTSMARADAVSVATSDGTSPVPANWAIAIGAPGPAMVAAAAAAESPLRRLCSRRTRGASALRRRERASERSQSSGAVRSRWAGIIRHVPFLSGLRG